MKVIGGFLCYVQAIHQKIQSLGFKDCHAKIRHVDCQETISSAVVIQVLAAFVMISIVYIAVLIF